MRRIASLILTLALVTACGSGPKVQVAAGALGPGDWSAWVFDGGGDLGTCLEIRAAGRETDKLCGLRPDNAGSWRPDAPNGEMSFLAVESGEGGAIVARAVFPDGKELRANVVGAASVTTLGFFIFALAPGLSANQVDLLDASGAVLSTLPLR